MLVPGEGPIPARIMLVGEAPGFEEERSGHPFVGASGRELDRMLHEAGILRSECFTSNVCRHRPPDNKMEAWVHLRKKGAPADWPTFRNGHIHPLVRQGVDDLMKEISLVQPNIILALGNVSLWTLTGLWGIRKWRGSELRVDWSSEGALVLPTYHPAYVLRDWGERAATVRDLRRARSLSGSRVLPAQTWKFTLRPSYEQVVDAFTFLLHKLSTGGPHKLVHDLETRQGHIACSGLAWSAFEAICVPFMCMENAEGYWTAEQEAHILWLHYQVLCHPNARVVNQNYLYDAQYTHRHWCFVGRFWRDTMILHHTAFCELPKALDYQASLYCERYRYWKDDSRDWDPKVGEDQLWYYCCEDTMRTWECDEREAKTIVDLKLEAPNAFQQDLFYPTLRAMTLGIRMDEEAKAEMRKELAGAAADRQAWLDRIFGHPVDCRSPTHLMRLFYEDLKQPLIIQKKTKRPTINEEALGKIARREPLLAPIVKKIIELRSIGVFVSTFINAKLDTDARLRCSFNPCGTYTFRYSSSKNAFWSGCVPAEAEVLTPQGWQRISTIQDGDLVVQWDSGILTFTPAKSHKEYYEGNWYKGEGEQFAWCYTAEHRVPFYDKRLKYLYQGPAKAAAQQTYIAAPVSGKINGPLSVSWPKLLVASLADGSYEGRKVRIALKRTRKIERLLQLFAEYGVEFTEQRATVDYRRFAFYRPADWPSEKAWGWWILGLKQDIASEMLKEARYWDGHSRGTSFWFFTKDLVQATVMSTLAHITGHSATQRLVLPHEKSWSNTPMWTVNIKPRAHVRVEKKHWSLEPYKGFVYCVTVPSSFFLMRWKNKICVTGNTNLQNIPKGVEAREPEDLELPNIRKLFVPDPGMTFFDMDLDRADAQVVAWEADDAELKAILKEGADLHAENAKALGSTRQLAKVWVHGTNYGGGARTMAVTCGLTVHSAEQMQKRWFQAHPGIKRWHERTAAQAAGGFITNIFGYKRFLFDRLDLPDALAWQPQSTVGRVINTAWQRLHTQAPWIWVQLQVHDSLAGSFPTERKQEALQVLKQLSQVTIPYPDPLVIPTGLKTSEISWGHCV